MSQRRVIPNFMRNDKNHVWNPTQCQRYQTYNESNTFYKNIEYSFSSDAMILKQSRNKCIENPDRKVFHNQTQIPNHLKKTTWSRSMIIQRIWTKNKITLTDLYPKSGRDIKTVLLHVPKDGMKFILQLDQSTEDVQTVSRTTYILFAAEIKNLQIAFQTKNIPFIIAMELIDQNQINPFPSIETRQILHIDRDDWENYRSFTVTPQVNVQDIVFMSTRFVYEYNGTPHLAEVTILDYRGVPIIKTYICPRAQILNYGRPSDGITGDLLSGQWDEWIIYPAISRKLKNKIIVGIKVSTQITKMRIAPNLIRGIRDLATAQVLENRFHIKKQWNINELATAYNECINKVEGTSGEANVIYKIYYKEEVNWKDDILPWEQDMLKVPWEIITSSSQTYCHFYRQAKKRKSFDQRLPDTVKTSLLPNISKPSQLPTPIAEKPIVSIDADMTEGIQPITEVEVTGIVQQQSVDMDEDSGNEIWLDPMGAEII